MQMTQTAGQPKLISTGPKFLATFVTKKKQSNSKNATEVLSGQIYATLSCLSPILADLTEKIEYNPLESTAIKSAEEAFRTDMCSRYKGHRCTAVNAQSNFFDPRFKTPPHLSATEIESKTPSLQREMVVLLQNQS